MRDDENNAVAFGDIAASEEQLKSIDELIKSYGKPVSFKAVSVDGSGGVSFNSQQTYFAASSIKAPYLLYCYKQMDNGDGTLTETMVYDSSYYKDGSGDMKNSANGTVYELSEIMRRVMWNVLGEGLPGLTIAQKYGIGYDVFCDTAIVYGKNQTYLLAIFTDSEANSKDKAFMNDLAKLINNIIDK